VINSHYATTSDVGTVGFSRGLNENGVSSKSRSDGLETPCETEKRKRKFGRASCPLCHCKRACNHGEATYIMKAAALASLQKSRHKSK